MNGSELDQAIRTLAAIVAAFWRDLLIEGIPEEIATELCGTLIHTWMDHVA